jgi:hypothetical protein
MKKKDLYKLVKQSLKELIQEQGPDKGGRDQELAFQGKTPSVDAPTGNIGTTGDEIDPIDLEPVEEPDFSTLTGFIAGTGTPWDICAADVGPGPNQIASGGTANYVNYGTFTTNLVDPTEQFGAGVCQSVTIADEYICCSSTNPDHNNIAAFNIQTNYNLSGLGSGNVTTSYNYPSSLGCYCPNPTTTQVTLNNGNTETALISCGLTGGTNSFANFDTWATAITSLGANWNAAGNWSVTQQGVTYTGLGMTSGCPGCTYINATNYNAAYNIENGSCVFNNVCTEQYFDNYFCDNQATITGGSTVAPGQNLCDANDDPIIVANPDPLALTNVVGVADLNDSDDCAYTGCFNANQPTGAPGYGLPNTNYECSTPLSAAAAVLCAGTLTGTNDQATSYTDIDNQSETPNMTNTGCIGVTPVLGCDNGDFDPQIGGNYNPNVNVPYNSTDYATLPCTFSGCLSETDGIGGTNSNWVCNLEPNLCTNQNNPGSQHDNSLGTFTDNGSCSSTTILGCTSTDYAEFSQFHSWNTADPNGPFADEADSNAFYCETEILEGCVVQTDPTNGTSNNYFCLDTAVATGTYACTGTNSDVLPQVTVQLPDPNNLPNLTATPVTLVTQGTVVCDYDLDDDGTNDDNEVFGCRDATATNYNANATDPGGLTPTAQDFLDGGCEYTFYGCTTPGATNFVDITNTTAFPNPPYVTDSTAANFNTTVINQVSATDTSDPCVIPNGCTDPNANNTHPNVANNLPVNEDQSCVFSGCTQPLATNQTQITSTVAFYNGKKLTSSTTVGSTTGPTLTGQTDDNSCVFDYCTSNQFPAPNGNYVCDAYPALCLNYNGVGTGTVNTGLGTWTNLNTTNGCTGGVKPGCTDNTEGDPLTINGVTYHNNLDVNGGATCGPNGNSRCLAKNYDPQATLNNPNDICNYDFCPDNYPDAFNGSPTDPRGDLWSNNPGNNAVSDLCEYEGCADNQNNPIQGAQQTVYPGWQLFSNDALYYYNQNNSGCQSGPFGGTRDGMYPTGYLNPASTACCAIGGCKDDGTWDFQWWDAMGYNAIYGAQTGNTYPNDMVGQPAPPSYPSNGMVSPVQANNLNNNTNANVDDGTCTYKFGCTVEAAPNYDPNAEVDDGSCLNPCKHIRAIQCNPSPGMDGDGNPVEHQIQEFCAHHGPNETPIMGDEFWSNKGIIIPPPPTGGPMISPPAATLCPQDHQDAIDTQNYMGQFGMPSSTWSGQGGAGIGNYPCAVASDIYGFNYRWSSGQSAWFWEGICAQCTTLNPTVLSNWGDPSGPVSGTCVKCSTMAPPLIPDITGGTGTLAVAEEPINQINAVFKIVYVNDWNGSSPLTVLNPWNCSQDPPVKTPGKGLDKFDDIGIETDSIKKVVGESKKIRKLIKKWKKNNL